MWGQKWRGTARCSLGVTLGRRRFSARSAVKRQRRPLGRVLHLSVHCRVADVMSALILNADGTAPSIASPLELAALWVTAAGGALVAHERLPWGWIRGQIGGLAATTLVRCPSTPLLSVCLCQRCKHLCCAAAGDRAAVRRAQAMRWRRYAQTSRGAIRPLSPQPSPACRAPSLGSRRCRRRAARSVRTRSRLASGNDSARQ